MSAEFFYYVASFLIIFFGVLIYLNEREHHRRVMDKQEIIAGSVTVLQNKVIKFEQTVESYRNKYLEQIKAYNDIHGHMTKVTDQMITLRRSHRILKEGLVRRYELVLKPDHVKAMKKVGEQLEQFS